MKKLFSAICVALLFFSCTQIDSPSGEPQIVESAVENDNFQVPPTLKNGILHFESWSSANFWIKETSNMDENSRRNWEAKFGNFHSLDALFEHLVEIENNSSDSLLRVYEATQIMPARINNDYPIHNKMIENYLDLLYFYPGGGFIPFASKEKPGIERILNEDGEVYVEGKNYKYKDGNIFIDGKILKSPDLKNAAITPTVYNERHQSTIGNYRTITDLFYDVQTRPISSMVNEYTVVGNIVLRNFRKGLFGWNTRKTTSLKIGGDLRYSLTICPVTDPTSYSIVQNYSNLNITSNGNNTTSIEFFFTAPTNDEWYSDIFCINASSKFVHNLNFNLTITGENNNVSTFARIF